MKKILAIVFSCVALSTATQSQTPAKTVFFELAGPGIASFNYDMRLANKEDGLGFRIGFGGYSYKDDVDNKRSGALYIPLGLNYLIGKDRRNYFELGAGATVVSTENTGSSIFNNTFGHLNFGYRLQPANSGFLFRATINPIFNDRGFIPYYGGFSFGYKF